MKGNIDVLVKVPLLTPMISLSRNNKNQVIISLRKSGCGFGLFVPLQKAGS